MRLPSKVTPYKSSVIALYPVILKQLSRAPMTPEALYRKVGKKFDGLAAFIETLDELYALGKVELIESEGLLRHVD